MKSTPPAGLATGQPTFSQPTSLWVYVPKPNPRPRLRLFCFAAAGGGATMFRTWPDCLPADVEVYGIKLPGRESRMKEALSAQLPLLIQTLGEVLGPFLSEPFAFFGHSLGARLSFELARQLRRTKRRGPAGLFVSGRRAPQIPEMTPLMHQLAEGPFKERIRGYQGTPEAILQNQELMNLFLPILRADFTLNETPPYTVEEPLQCPIFAFGGAADPRTERWMLQGWREQTRERFELEIFPGGHFYLQEESRDGFLRALSLRLSAVG